MSDKKPPHKVKPHTPGWKVPEPVALDTRAVESAANVFMSFLPHNNRPTLPSDRHAAHAIVSAYMEALRWHREREGACEWLAQHGTAGPSPVRVPPLPPLGEGEERGGEEDAELVRVLHEMADVHEAGLRKKRRPKVDAKVMRAAAARLAALEREVENITQLADDLSDEAVALRSRVEQAVAALEEIERESNAAIASGSTQVRLRFVAIAGTLARKALTTLRAPSGDEGTSTEGR